MGCLKCSVNGHGQVEQALAAITKYHRLSGLNNRHLFLIDLVSKKSKIKMLAHSVPGEGPLPSLQVATFLL